ncbi:hypothetical protein JRO89_XS08G0255600 [Xanthoceras sorbifolium]|uniref:RCC1-like domain-containing protein n=1 Tax=Xanthoceras sorbifolium TaxID=99658 RepID=A0ABQ8HRH3_9ROSI|nr:hypothetical protein JRO89_XS08G0255600 [Xanthoceras sorbifolium]
MAEMSATDVTAPFRRVLLISAGASHSVALLSGNIVCSWGRGEDGQLGHGDAEDRLSPTQLSALDGHEIVSLTCGADHTTAFSESRMEVYSWGWGDFGRLGHGNSSDLFTPQPIKALQGLRIKQIACGDSHCLAVTMEGEVQSWGRNQNGQLGLGTTVDSLVPQKIQAFQGVSIKMVSAGAEHTVAVTEDGDLYGWGWGRYGNLGLGDRNDRLVPEKVANVYGEKMVMVACGWRHTISVSSSGGLYTYGWSKYGQLGHGDFEDHLVPHKLEALHGSFISQVSGGWRHTMALTSNGKLYGWGWNKVGISASLLFALYEFCINLSKVNCSGYSGSYFFSLTVVGCILDRLELVTTLISVLLCKSNFPMTRHILVTVAPENCYFSMFFFFMFLFGILQKVVQISCGWRHTLAVTERQNVFSWGRGTNGQLGHGESSDRNIPKIIEPLSVDGSSGQQIESSKFDPSSGKTWVSPSERYAVVPDDNVSGCFWKPPRSDEKLGIAVSLQVPGQTNVPARGNGSDVSVPESDVKRVRI